MATARSRKKKSRSRVFLTILVVIGFIALYLVYKVFGPNTGSFASGEYFYIHTGANYETVKETLKQDGFVKDINSFDLLAKRAGYPTHVHPGRYKITRGMSNYNLVRLLHSGRQEPVKLVINKIRTVKDFVILISANLEADSTVLKQMFHDPTYLAQFGIDTNTVLCAVMPNTYEFFWNTNADNAFRKIEKSYSHFWDSSHVKQAKEQGLTPNEAITVASIVDEESNKADEKPNIASVYLNRINKGMKLQADPTVKYAVGDFTIRRITGAMLLTESPYNTYKYMGLPPGPICTPSLSSINAVLNAPKTNFLYFCAKEDFSGYHNFAATYDEQLKNAHAYQQALDQRGIH